MKEPSDPVVQLLWYSLRQHLYFVIIMIDNPDYGSRSCLRPYVPSILAKSSQKLAEDSIMHLNLPFKFPVVELSSIIWPR